MSIHHSTYDLMSLINQRPRATPQLTENMAASIESGTLVSVDLMCNTKAPQGGGGVGHTPGITAAELPGVGGTWGYHLHPSGPQVGHHQPGVVHHQPGVVHHQKAVFYLHMVLNYCFCTCTHNTST
jgi:hypothetical protein